MKDQHLIDWLTAFSKEEADGIREYKKLLAYLRNDRKNVLVAKYINEILKEEMLHKRVIDIMVKELRRA